MKSLQREFLTLSTLAHGALIAMLLFGTAFLSKPTLPEEPEPITLLTFIPDELVDEDVAQARAPAPPRRQQPPARTPERRPEPPQPKPAPPEPALPKPATPKPKPAAPKPKPAERWKPSETIVPDLNKVTRASPAAERIRQQREAERKRALAQSLARLRQGLTSEIEYSVPGAGGASYANYAAYVRTLYDRNWREPATTSSAHPVVKTRVVIARDGRVISAKILSRSGDAALDRSVQNVLDRIKNIGRSFPRGAKDDRRSFILNFNLIAKHGLG